MCGRKVQGIISADWNGCLAPGGPFDVIEFHYPELLSILSEVFKKYTSNIISFREATLRVQAIIPAPIAEEQMDAYLDASFRTYPGVPELIEWCQSKGIVFMINTTGPQGYFQRVLSKRLLPQPSVLSASTFIRYPGRNTDPPCIYDLEEIDDKPRHTAAVLAAKGIPGQRAILIGDSGGDGPHFEWGWQVGACLIGSMTKPSRQSYCKRRGVKTSRHFGISYADGEGIALDKEMRIHFMDLVPIIEEVLEV